MGPRCPGHSALFEKNKELFHIYDTDSFTNPSKVITPPGVEKRFLNNECSVIYYRDPSDKPDSPYLVSILQGLESNEQIQRISWPIKPDPNTTIKGWILSGDLSSLKLIYYLAPINPSSKANVEQTGIIRVVEQTDGQFIVKTASLGRGVAELLRDAPRTAILRWAVED